eukprot:8628887-Lingulodinium_polyedra.AAC.1
MSKHDDDNDEYDMAMAHVQYALEPCAWSPRLGPPITPDQSPAPRAARTKGGLPGALDGAA